MGRTGMSAKELTRVKVLSRVKAGTLSVGSAATERRKLIAEFM